MHFALFIRRTVVRLGSQTGVQEGNIVREKGQFLLEGNSQGWESQGWDSLYRLLAMAPAMVESLPFEKY
jgi:hypothetical protein